MDDNSIQSTNYGPSTRSLEEIATSIRSRLKRTVEDIIEIGKSLIEAKGQLGYSSFGVWCDEQFPGMSRETRSKFMQVAERFGNVRISDNLSPSVYQLLASPSISDSVVAEVLNTAEGGEKIGIDKAKKIIKAMSGTEPRVESPPVSEEKTVVPEIHPLALLHDLTRRLLKNGMKIEEITSAVRDAEPRNPFAYYPFSRPSSQPTQGEREGRPTRKGVEADEKKLEEVEQLLATLIPEMVASQGDFLDQLPLWINALCHASDKCQRRM